jgi:molybdopterin-guanine dinucleotide biosynthesis protein A
MSAAAESVTLGILAGGAGRRLGGVDKGLVPVEGATQIQRTRRLLAGDFAQVLASANRHRDRYAALGFTVVADALPGFQGPLAGVSALLAACTAPLLLTVPVDVVGMPADLAERLRQALSTGAASLVRLRDDDGLQPAVALYRSHLAASAAAALAGGERSLQRWQEAVGSSELWLPCRIGNRNRPEDYR